MKKIETLIHPLHWAEARTVLETLGIRATLREVRTFGRTPPKREVFRGSTYFRDATPELELSVLVEDELVESTVAALETIGGEGELLVSSVIGVVHFGESKRATVQAMAAPTVSERATAARSLLAAAARA